MCHTRAPSAARRARAREWRGGLGVDCDRGRGRTAPSTLRLFVGRREACIENAPCAWPCATQFAVYFRIPKERPAWCVACTRAEHSRAVRTRVHNDRITIRRVTLTRAVAGIRVYGRPASGAVCVYFTPPRHRETDTASVREGGGRRAHADETRAPAMRFPNAAALMRQRPRIRRPELWLGSSNFLFFVPDIAMECRRRGRGLARTGALASSGGTGRGHRAVLRLEQDQCKRVVSSRTNAARRLLHTLVVARAVLKLPRS